MGWTHPAASRARPSAGSEVEAWENEFIGAGRLDIRAPLEKQESSLAQDLLLGGLGFAGRVARPPHALPHDEVSENDHGKTTTGA